MKKLVFAFLFSITFINIFAENIYINKNETKIEKNAADSFDFDKNFTENIEQTDYRKTFIKMLFSIGAIIILSIITIWSLKRISKNRILTTNNLKKIKVLEKRVISPKSIIYLIECEGKKGLITESHLDVKIKMLDDEKNKINL